MHWIALIRRSVANSTNKAEHYEYVVRITDNAPSDINVYLFTFAIVVGICFIIMLAIMVFMCIQ